MKGGPTFGKLSAECNQKGEKMPRLAILTAVFRDSEGLARTLLNLPDDASGADIYVVDDGSIPPVVLSEGIRSDVSIRLLRLEKNSGAAAARNAGLREILSGDYEYVAVLDAGDVALPGRFSQTVEFLDRHREYGLVGGQARFVTPSGEIGESFPTRHEDIKRVMHARACFIHSTVTFRADVLRKLGGYNEEFVAAHDYELIWRVIRAGYKVANLDEVLVEYFLDPRGVTVTRRRKQIFNRMMVMLANFDPWIIESYLGIAKNLLLLILPFRWVWQAKQVFRKRPKWL